MSAISIDLGTTGTYLQIGSEAHGEVLLVMRDEDGDLAATHITLAKLHELAAALLQAAGVQPVIGLRGITSADFEAGLHNDNGYDPETAGIE